PLDLLHRIRDSQAALAALSSGELCGEDRESIEQFLAGLPELWRKGGARATPREKPTSPRYWGAREDPFQKVWPGNLLWLQEEPDASAKYLFERLGQNYPGQFPEGQLRTLQRRIQDWRRVMARNLVHGGQDGETPVVVGAHSEE